MRSQSRPASTKIPVGPVKPYQVREDLLSWMSNQFERFGDIYKASILGNDVYVIRDPRYAMHVLVRNWQNYNKGQIIKRIAFLLGNGLMVSEGELWRRQRRMIQPAFQHSTISALAQPIASVNFSLLGKWREAAENNTTVNVTQDVSRMVLDVVLKFIFGDGDDYHHVAPHFAVLSQHRTRNMQFAHAFRRLGTPITEVIVRRRARQPRLTDTLGLLMAARDRETDRPMTERQLVNEILTLVVAGHETTASSLAWTWYLLSQYGDADQKLFDELDGLWAEELPSVDDLRRFAYTRQIIEETLRLFPAGWLMTRRARNDDHLGKYFVPAGTEIYVSPYFIQRHPGLWPDPDRFDPNRFTLGYSAQCHPLAMLPFSAGPRNCIGEFLARLEMQMHLMIIAKHLRLRLVSTEPSSLMLASTCAANMIS
jgi:cytochrome P450